MSGYLPMFGLVFAIALTVSAAATPFARLLGLRMGLVDRPGGRRQHSGAISRLGGIALYGGFTVAVLVTALLPAEWFPPRLDPKETTRLAGLLVGTGLIFLFGLLDDRYQFSSWPQYLVQFLSCFIAIAAIVFIERVNNPFTDQQVVFPLFFTVPFDLSFFFFR